jgi:hypothetical protein
VTSYLASSQAQQGSTISSGLLCSATLASQSCRLKRPESIAQISLKKSDSLFNHLEIKLSTAKAALQHIKLGFK